MKFRKLPALFLSSMLASMGLFACGEDVETEDENGEKETEHDMTDEEYFGLIPGKCYGYLGHGGVEVIVEITDGHILDGVDLLGIFYTVNEMAHRDEYVHVNDDGELVVGRRQDYSTGGHAVFDPAYLISRRPLEQTLDGPHRTTTMAENLGLHAEDSEWEVSVTIETRRPHDVPAFDEPVEAFPHLVRHSPQDEGDERVDNFSMAAGVGFVSLDLAGLPEVELVSTWTAGDEGCGSIPTD